MSTDAVLNGGSLPSTDQRHPVPVVTRRRIHVVIPSDEDDSKQCDATSSQLLGAPLTDVARGTGSTKATDETLKSAGNATRNGASTTVQAEAESSNSAAEVGNGLIASADAAGSVEKVVEVEAAKQLTGASDASKTGNEKKEAKPTTPAGGADTSKADAPAKGDKKKRAKKAKDQQQAPPVVTESDKSDDLKPPQQESISETEAIDRIQKLRSVTQQLKAAVDDAKQVSAGVGETSERLDTLKSADHNGHAHDHDHHHHHHHHDHGEEHEHGDEFNAELVSKAKQSRSEKKARKSLSKMGLKQVNGIAQVTIRRKKNVVFVINRPDVYVNSSSETYIIFGEARIEDTEERVKQEAARHITESADNALRGLTKPSAEAATVEHESDEETVDEAGIDQKDIELVMSQASVSRQRAIRALKNNNNDIVNAIMALTT